MSSDPDFRRGAAVLLILSTLSVCAVGVLAYTATPAELTAAAVRGLEGEYVAVRGTLVEMRTKGWTYGVVRDGTGEVEFYARSVPRDAVPGASVRVAGFVVGGKIIVKRDGDLRVLSPPRGVTVELLLRNPDHFLGQEVVVEGYAFSFTSHHYENVVVVSDGTGEARVLVRKPVYGSALHLYGRVVMDKKYEIDATPYGLYERPQEVNAEDVRLSELDEHRGRLVHIVVDVLRDYCVGTFFTLRGDGEHFLKCFFPRKEVSGSGWARVRGKIAYFEDEGRYVLICEEVTFLRDKVNPSACAIQRDTSSPLPSPSAWGSIPHG